MLNYAKNWIIAFVFKINTIFSPKLLKLEIITLTPEKRELFAEMMDVENVAPKYLSEPGKIPSDDFSPAMFPSPHHKVPGKIPAVPNVDPRPYPSAARVKISTIETNKILKTFAISSKNCERAVWQNSPEILLRVSRKKLAPKELNCPLNDMP
jgi:hypothetical protein